MREVQVTCPQCGRQDAYFEPEQADYTNTMPIFIQQPWRCPSCGYPDVQWNQFVRTSFQKVVVDIKLTDAEGNVIKRWQDDLL